MIRCAAFAAIALAAQQPPPAELTDATLEAWHSWIIPARDQFAWREIPWRPVFWDAVVEAQKKEMPVLLWAMNGHPLGCT